MRLSCLKRDSRFKIQDSKCEKILISHPQPSALSPQPFESGFTLVEIAMVLVLLGVLVTFGMTLVGPLTKKLKYNATKEIIQADVDGIEGWSYDGKLLPTSGTWATVVRNPNDAWLAPLYYVYDVNLTTGGICGRSTTTLSTATISNVAFAVLSAADDHIVQTTLASITIAASGAGTGQLATPSTSDDIVYLVTLNELRTKAGCKGAQLQILNQELPVGISSQTYSAYIYVDPAYAGVPSGGNYTWSYTWNTTPTGITVTPASGGSGANLYLSAPSYPSGTSAGNYKITVTVTDSNANSVSKALLLEIQ